MSVSFWSEDILVICVQAALVVAKKLKYCQRGDSIVALHRIGNASVIKIVDIK